MDHRVRNESSPARNEWWRPDQLGQSERATRNVDDIAALDPRNDFSSYRRVLLGDDLRAASVPTHNELRPIGKIRWIAKTLDLQPGADVLDAGCGLGFTTQALHDFFGGSALGVDVSADAVAWATKTHRGPVFKARAISPEGDDLGRFDLIFCFEFYPFTRNRDVAVQAAFIRYFARQLKVGGKLIIFQYWNNPDSLSHIHREVSGMLPGLALRVRRCPHPRLPLWLPLWAAMLASRCLVLAGRDGVKRFFTVEVLPSRAGGNTVALKDWRGESK